MPRLTFLFLLLSVVSFGQAPGFDINHCQIFTLPALQASRITNTGEILGQGQGSAFLIRNGVISPVALPVAGVGAVYANGMNESGDIVGEYRDAGNVARPFVIIQETFQTLSDEDGRTPVPADINQQRVITGAARKQGQYDIGFIRKYGNYAYFQCDPDGHTNPWGINHNGDVAGICGTYTNLRGFVYHNGAFLFVTYPGAARTRVWDINTNGDLVGDAIFEDPQGRTWAKAFLWRNGVFHDLSFPGVRQSLARSINDQGDVLGNVTIVHNDNAGSLLELGSFNFVRDTRHLK
ncbi:MAG: hypothetical protein IT165_34350 [Bryobacterales bacterium]|nr:hypothetical protein [Bryobacterales bacterium]